MNPKISVILSTYNHIDLLPRAVNSILNQTFKDFEFIIINDGSTDKTQEYLKTLIDGRIRFVVHEQNRGIRPSYNEGLQMAEGKYITWISSDNFHFPTFLEKFVKVLDENPDAVFAYSAFYWMNSKGETTGKNEQVYLGHHALILGSPGIASFMYRRSIHEKLGYLFDIGVASDTDFWIRMSEEYGINSFVYVQEPLMYYLLDETVDTMKQVKDGRMQISLNKLMDRVIKRRRNIRQAYKPHILYVAHTFPPRSFTGTETYSYNLAKGIMGKGYNVSVVHREMGESNLIELKSYNDIQVYNILSQGDIGILDGHYKQQDIEFNFIRLLDDVRPDIIHFQHIMGLPFSLIDISKKCGYPVCISLHDFWFICPLTFLVKTDGTVHHNPPATIDECVNCMKMGEGWNIAQLASTYFHLAYRLNYAKELLEKSDYNVCASRYVRRIFNQVFGRESTAMVELAPLGLPPMGQLYSHPKGRPLTFGFFGAIHPVKNVKMVVEVFKKIKGDIQLVIWGTGIKEYIEEIQIDDDPRIRYLGPYTPDQLSYVLSTMDVSIHPSLNESYSLSIRESLQAGIPVIISNAEVYKEIPNIGMCSWCFGNEDSLRHAIMRFIDGGPQLIEQMKSAIPKIRLIDEDIEEWDQRYKNLLK
jgi:glycosyltransferase involved in cell wall biosynthesis